jgi:HlyD family secretion protein
MRTKLAAWLAMVLAGLALAGCDKSNDRQLQGWVEAELIFVSPDEQGRVETLKVREGDRVKKGDLLFTVDDDLQKADLVVRNAAVVNAQQNFDRAKVLLKTAAGTQKTFDDAEAALRQAQANLAWSQTRLARRNAYSPAEGTVQQVYYRPGETVPAGRPVVALLPPQNLKLRFFAPEGLLPEVKYGETVAVSCDGCEKGLSA